jgi:hypothetical protein
MKSNHVSVDQCSTVSSISSNSFRRESYEKETNFSFSRSKSKKSSNNNLSISPRVKITTSFAAAITATSKASSSCVENNTNNKTKKASYSCVENNTNSKANKETNKENIQQRPFDRHEQLCTSWNSTIFSQKNKLICD